MPCSGLKILKDIAKKQSAESPPAAKGKKPAKPLLSSEGMLPRLWGFIRDTLAIKALEPKVAEEKQALAAQYAEAFMLHCRENQQWFSSANIAGGTVKDPETGEIIHIRDGDVQWQQTLRSADVEVGTDAEKKLNSRARELMPEYASLSLKDEVSDPKVLAELVKDLGPGLIAKWFQVRTCRKALKSDDVRELYFDGAEGRKAVESMIAAGAASIVQFPKIMHDPRRPEEP